LLVLVIAKPTLVKVTTVPRNEQETAKTMTEDRATLVRSLQREMGSELNQRQLNHIMQGSSDGVVGIIDRIVNKLAQNRQNFQLVVNENQKLKNMLSNLAISVSSTTPPSDDERPGHHQRSFSYDTSQMLSTSKVLRPRRSTIGTTMQNTTTRKHKSHSPGSIFYDHNVPKSWDPVTREFH
jgi:hypothetical protein